MRRSEYFLYTLKETPKEAESPSHVLLLRAGFILQEAAGIFSYLPIAVRSMQKIIEIIREEMNRIGGQEILMPVLNLEELWAESGRSASRQVARRSPGRPQTTPRSTATPKRRSGTDRKRRPNRPTRRRDRQKKRFHCSIGTQS